MCKGVIWGIEFLYSSGSEVYLAVVVNRLGCVGDKLMEIVLKSKKILSSYWSMI